METTRRDVLARAGALAGVTSATATTGCLGSHGGSGDSAVSILAAGSLQRALATRFREQTDRRVTVESRGSAACARMVREGLRDPDLLALADPVLFDGLTPEYTAFATNSLVVAYNPETAVGQAVAAADVPLDPLRRDAARFGRTDPDADPLGYRTLFAFDLAGERWNRNYSSLLDPSQIFPETELLAVLETGEIDAVVSYRNMAVDHDVPFRTLPPAVDLSAPQFADRYAEYSYELPSGRVVRGTPITYGASLQMPGDEQELDDDTRAVFEQFVGGDWLGEGFDVPRPFPAVRES